MWYFFQSLGWSNNVSDIRVMEKSPQGGKRKLQWNR